ncbi:BldC family transcriptional regulator [Nocardiopsis dassonvillei]|uniref:BldC family transcriptional regulator n=1 Tax=Nocardiopsis dassonvillei TaxID=2014 RepID=UPI00200D8C93|nr:BldC family transcriptional regulator [Nocardiopsis dassonvillei]MCK9871685.1 BldC family transcriptional regulator [Nocardiopsis dassonvillei]
MTHTPRTDLPGPLLTVAEVGDLFRVNPRTVNRWVAQGRIPVVRTPGGHLRFDPAEVRRLLWIDQPPAT